MVIVPIGGGKTAEIKEPNRVTDFPPTLGGAVEFAFTHFIYSVFRIMGGGVGSFLGGVGVQFLEAIEPDLVEYAKPLIDMILAYKDLDPGLRTFFVQLKNPVHEAAGVILAGLSSQAGGAVAGTVLSAILKPLTNDFNAAVHASVPSVTDLAAMWWRDPTIHDEISKLWKYNGFTDAVTFAYRELAQPRAGVGDLYSAAYRGTGTVDAVDEELAKRGFGDSDRLVFATNSHPLLDLNTSLQAAYRGVITPQQAGANILKLGFSEADVEILVHTLAPMPQVGDLIRFGVREAYRDDVASRYGYDADFPPGFATDMAKLGYSPEWAKYFWRAHWELPSVQLGMEMTHRGLLTPDEFKDLLHLADYPVGWRDKMAQVIYNPYTRVDVRRMYGQGILTREQVKRSYMDGGYDDEHAENLTAWTIAYEDGNGGSIPEALKGITEGVITSAVAKGMMADDEAQTALIALKNSPDVADLMIELAHWKATVAAKPEPKPDFPKDVRAITERAYLNGLVDNATATGQLTAVGYTAEEADFILRAIDYARAEREQEDQLSLISQAYLNGAIERVDVVTKLGALDLPATQQALLLDKWDSVLALPNRRLTESQYRACFKIGLIAKEDYTQAMIDLGYSENDVTLLTALYTAPAASVEE